MDEQLPPEPAHYDQAGWREWCKAHIKHLLKRVDALEGPKVEEVKDAEPADEGSGDAGGEADGDLGEAG